jgi:hypothetical protein
MRIRAALAAALALVASLALAAPAVAHDNGEGLVGETDDKIITFFSLGVIVFFVLLVIVGTIIQSLLEKRKEAREALKMRQRVGW